LLATHLSDPHWILTQVGGMGFRVIWIVKS
jgi:hypothetical protein